MDLYRAETLAVELMGQFGLLGKDMVLYQPNVQVEAIRARHAHEGRLYPLSTRWHFGFDSARRQFGCCHYGPKKITLSKTLVQINNEQQVRDTILHEIAHALCPNNAHHGPVWKAMARAVGAKPERCYSTKDVATITYKWRWICPGCGNEETAIQHRAPGFDGEQICMACYKAAKTANPQDAGYQYRRFYHKWQRLEQIVKQPRGEAHGPTPITMAEIMTQFDARLARSVPPAIAPPPDAPIVVKPKLERDPGGRTCPECAEQLSETIPLDINGTCHGCGCCFGKYVPPAPPRPFTPTQAKIETNRVIALYQRGLKVVDIAVECGYRRGQGQNRVRSILTKAGIYRKNGVKPLPSGMGI